MANNEKTLNTRIMLKVDTLEKWNASTLPLKKGEIAIATVAATAGNGLTEPVCMIKIGEDGVKTFKDLGWNFYAKASDVYSWAKTATFFVDGNNGEGNAFTNVEWDTTLNGGKGGLKFTKGTTFATKAELDDAIEKFTGDVGSITDTDTKTTVELITTEGDAHKGQIKVNVQKTVDGENDGAATVTYIDVVTPDELTIILADYVTTGNLEDFIGFTPTSEHPTFVDLVDAKDAEVLAAAKEYADNNDANTEYHVEYDSTNKKIKLVAGADASKMEIDATAFIKDGMVNNVEISEGNLVITFNTDAGKDAISVPLESLVDVYTGVDGTTITVNVSADDKISAEVKTNSIKDGHIASDAAIAKTKLASDVQTSLGLANSALQEIGHGPNGSDKDELVISTKTMGVQTIELSAKTRASLAKADSALQEHQDISGKADKVSGATSGNLAGLDASGNLIDSGSKAGDFATAAQGAKADTAVQTFNNMSTEYISINGSPIASVSVTDKVKNGIAAAETALQEIEAGTGLKVSAKANNKQTIEIDEAVTFIFDCGGAGV